MQQGTLTDSSIFSHLALLLSIFGAETFSLHKERFAKEELYFSKRRDISNVFFS